MEEVFFLISWSGTWNLCLYSIILYFNWQILLFFSFSTVQSYTFTLVNSTLTLLCMFFNSIDLQQSTGSPRVTNVRLTCNLWLRTAIPCKVYYIKNSSCIQWLRLLLCEEHQNMFAEIGKWGCLMFYVQKCILYIIILFN